MASEKILTVTPDNFESEVLGSDVPVLVDFWAAWCGPCRIVAPHIEALAEELDGKIRVAKLDVDSNQEIAFRYQVSSIPSFLLFKDGQVADRMLGAMPKAALEGFVSRNL